MYAWMLVFSYLLCWYFCSPSQSLMIVVLERNKWKKGERRIGTCMNINTRRRSGIISLWNPPKLKWEKYWKCVYFSFSYFSSRSSAPLILFLPLARSILLVLCFIRSSFPFRFLWTRFKVYCFLNCDKMWY